jgi:hypothetical protein
MSGVATRDDVENLGRAVEGMTAALSEASVAQTQALRELAAAFGDQRHVESARATGGRVDVNVSAGGLAVWIAATFCAVAMTSTLFLGGIVLWLAIRTNDHGHQMNALYQSVPGLRELVAEQVQLNQATKESATHEEKPNE